MRRHKEKGKRIFSELRRGRRKNAILDEYSLEGLTEKVTHKQRQEENKPIQKVLGNRNDKCQAPRQKHALVARTRGEEAGSLPPLF